VNTFLEQVAEMEKILDTKVVPCSIYAKVQQFAKEND
jgi:hypothetical protein